MNTSIEYSIKFIYEYRRGMRATNMIRSLYFRFDANIRCRLKHIELKTGVCKTRHEEFEDGAWWKWSRSE